MLSITSTGVLPASSIERSSLQSTHGSHSRQQRGQDEMARVLEEIAGEIMASSDTLLVFASATQRVKIMLGADACHYNELVPDHMRLRVRASSDLSIPNELQPESTGLDSLGRYTLFTSEPVIVPHTGVERRFTVPSTYLERGVLSIAAVAVRVHGEPVGMLSVESHLPLRFSAREAGILSTVARLLALAEERRRAAAARRALQRISGLLDGIASDEARMVADVERVLADHFGGTCVIWLADPERPETGPDQHMPHVVERARSVSASPARPSIMIDGDSNEITRLLRTQTMVTAQAALGEPSRVATSDSGGYPHVARVPMIENGRPLGSITCQREHPYPPFGEDDTILMTEAAGRLMAAVSNARLRSCLEDRQRRLDDALDQMVSIEETERRRVALSIHDGLAQVAASAYRHLEVFDSHYTTDDEQNAIDLARAKALARRTIREARRLIADLRPTVLDEFGLISALQAEVDDLRASGWDVRFEHSLGDERFPDRIEVDLFRLAQESLANVSKHAGLTRVDVSVTRLPGAIRLVVRDYGNGFDPDQLPLPTRSSERVGLSGMKERMRLLGGNVTIQSRAGEGTRVAAEIPA